jgi:type VI secretion system secreted protein VgrG
MPEQRSVRLTSVLGDKLRFRLMSGEEALSRPFRFELELASDDPSIHLADLLGTPVAVEVDVLGGGKRWFHGLVSRFAFAGHEHDEARYRATLRPWLWFLSRTADCRIFQEKTAPEIVRAIFEKHADPAVEVEDRLTGAFAKRVYCVQYRESDLDFVARLMEDEGITYFFTHEADKHTLVLANAPAAHRGCPQYEEVPYYPEAAMARRERDHVHGWDARAEVRSGSFAHTSFDFEKPRADLLARRDQPLPQAAWAEGEVYLYSGCYTEPAAGEQAAILRLEADQADHRLVAGEGTAAGLAAGHRFKLRGYPRGDQNAEYLLREVEHELWDPAYRTGTPGGEEVEVYRCRFTAMPADVPYRPPLATPRPLIRGPQTAMVTGPAGEEIWTDKYGRVKVQFPWDREGKRDEKTSCWIRVSQAWAGTGFGAMVIPRIGQEVIVEFLEGDPDRPIITGRVYNAQAMPPYTLPGGQNQSGLKSNSTKGGGGSNELMFDDTKGREKVAVHAQYDMSTTVEHDKTTNVVNDMSTTVKKNETHTVTEGNRAIRVQAGTHTETIKGATTITIETGPYSHRASANTATRASKGTSILRSESGDVRIEAATDITIVVGSSMIYMGADGFIQVQGVNIAINGSESVSISGNAIRSIATLEHETKGNLVTSEGTATNTIKGGMVMLNPPG